MIQTLFPRRWPASRQWMLPLAIAFACAVIWGAAKGSRAHTMLEANVPGGDIRAAEEEIRTLVGKYAKSIDAADTTLAAQVWWDSPQVTFIHPQGHEHGFEQIKEHVYQRLMGETFSERRLTPRDISVHVYGSAAWTEFYWEFSAKFRKDGSPLTTHGRETQVYWKLPEGWRLVHVHYAGMPVTQ